MASGPRKKAEAEAPASRIRAIKAAATRCIKKFGARKVSVDDIATEAGISRRTFYRFFPERRAVMEAVMLDRLEALATAVKDVIANCPTFEEAVIVGSIETLRRARQDKIYVSIAESDYTLLLDLEKSERAAPREGIFNSIWEGIFSKANQDKILRTDVTLHEAEDWLRSMHYMLSLREDLTDDDRADLIRKFILPSLLKVSPPPDA